MTCLVRLEQGICGKPKTGAFVISLPPRDHLFYIETLQFKDVPMCAEHLGLIQAGWNLKPSLLFRWVPPV